MEVFFRPEELQTSPRENAEKAEARKQVEAYTKEVTNGVSTLTVPAEQAAESSSRPLPEARTINGEQYAQMSNFLQRWSIARNPNGLALLSSIASNTGKNDVRSLHLGELAKLEGSVFTYAHDNTHLDTAYQTHTVRVDSDEFRKWFVSRIAMTIDREGTEKALTKLGTDGLKGDLDDTALSERLGPAGAEAVARYNELERRATRHFSTIGSGRTIEDTETLSPRAFKLANVFQEVLNHNAGVFRTNSETREIIGRLAGKPELSEADIEAFAGQGSQAREAVLNSLVDGALSRAGILELSGKTEHITELRKALNEAISHAQEVGIGQEMIPDLREKLAQATPERELSTKQFASLVDSVRSISGADRPGQADPVDQIQRLAREYVQHKNFDEGSYRNKLTFHAEEAWEGKMLHPTEGGAARLPGDIESPMGTRVPANLMETLVREYGVRVTDLAPKISRDQEDYSIVNGSFSQDLDSTVTSVPTLGVRPNERIVARDQRENDPYYLRTLQVDRVVNARNQAVMADVLPGLFGQRGAPKHMRLVYDDANAAFESETVFKDTLRGNIQEILSNQDAARDRLLSVMQNAEAGEFRGNDKFGSLSADNQNRLLMAAREYMGAADDSIVQKLKDGQFDANTLLQITGFSGQVELSGNKDADIAAIEAQLKGPGGIAERFREVAFYAGSLSHLDAEGSPSTADDYLASIERYAARRDRNHELYRLETIVNSDDSIQSLSFAYFRDVLTMNSMNGENGLATMTLSVEELNELRKQHTERVLEEEQNGRIPRTTEERVQAHLELAQNLGQQVSEVDGFPTDRQSLQEKITDRAQEFAQKLSETASSEKSDEEASQFLRKASERIEGALSLEDPAQRVSAIREALLSDEVQMARSRLDASLGQEATSLARAAHTDHLYEASTTLSSDPTNAENLKNLRSAFRDLRSELPSDSSELDPVLAKGFSRLAQLDQHPPVYDSGSALQTLFSRANAEMSGQPPAPHILTTELEGLIRATEERKELNAVISKKLDNQNLQREHYIATSERLLGAVSSQFAPEEGNLVYPQIKNLVNDEANGLAPRLKAMIAAPSSPIFNNGEIANLVASLSIHAKDLQGEEPGSQDSFQRISNQLMSRLNNLEIAPGSSVPQEFEDAKEHLAEIRVLLASARTEDALKVVQEDPARALVSKLRARLDVLSDNLLDYEKEDVLSPPVRGALEELGKLQPRKASDAIAPRREPEDERIPGLAGGYGLNDRYRAQIDAVHRAEKRSEDAIFHSSLADLYTAAEHYINTGLNRAAEQGTDTEKEAAQQAVLEGLEPFVQALVIDTQQAKKDHTEQELAELRQSPFYRAAEHVRHEMLSYSGETSDTSETINISAERLQSRRYADPGSPKTILENLGSRLQDRARIARESAEDRMISFAQDEEAANSAKRILDDELRQHVPTLTQGDAKNRATDKESLIRVAELINAKYPDNFAVDEANGRLLWKSDFGEPEHDRLQFARRYAEAVLGAETPSLQADWLDEKHTVPASEDIHTHLQDHSASFLRVNPEGPASVRPGDLMVQHDSGLFSTEKYYGVVTRVEPDHLVVLELDTESRTLRERVLSTDNWDVDNAEDDPTLDMGDWSYGWRDDDVMFLRPIGDELRRSAAEHHTARAYEEEQYQLFQNEQTVGQPPDVRPKLTPSYLGKMEAEMFKVFETEVNSTRGSVDFKNTRLERRSAIEDVIEKRMGEGHQITDWGDSAVAEEAATSQNKKSD